MTLEIQVFGQISLGESFQMIRQEKVVQTLVNKKDINFSEFCLHVQSYLTLLIDLDVYCAGAILLQFSTLVLTYRSMSQT